MSGSSFRVVPPSPETSGEWVLLDVVTGAVTTVASETELYSLLWGAARHQQQSSVSFSRLASQWIDAGWQEALDQLMLSRIMPDLRQTDWEPLEVPQVQQSESRYARLTQAVHAASSSSWSTARGAPPIRTICRWFTPDGPDGWMDLAKDVTVHSDPQQDRTALFGAFRAPFEPVVVCLLAADQPIGALSVGSHAQATMMAAGALFRRIEMAVNAMGFHCAAHYGFDDDALAATFEDTSPMAPLLSIAIGEANR